MKNRMILAFLLMISLAACAPGDGPAPDHDSEISAVVDTQAQPAPQVNVEEEEAPAPKAAAVAPTTPTQPEAPAPVAVQPKPVPQVAAKPAATIYYTPVPPEVPVAETPTVEVETAPPVKAPTPKAAAPAATTYEKELLTLINNSRARANLPALSLSLAQSRGTSKCTGSYGHSVYMQRVGHINHDQFPADICLVTNARAENVGMSSGGVDYAIRSLHNDMMNERGKAHDGHYQNIMSPTYNAVGIGLYYHDGILWMTEDFFVLQGSADLTM